ncbi:SCP2 sterol-binding domain-containing protein [Neobacillus dielmonensis]|uniref:SCP2 sterol-binding domain-containing protein n=1 Tax=Neobacillus dielmonensis TaxID=1347369 RepID=UPI0005AA2F02|nr:SCP2 sterol-binding domain-containing protein [Neobacillus dielmonensis]
MLDVINTFLLIVRGRTDILPLIEQADIQLQINSEQQTILLKIKNGAISIEAEKDNLPNVTISGHQSALTLLFEGKEKLRILQKNGALKVTAPLRTTLMLESLFYLVKADPQLAKII